MPIRPPIKGYGGKYLLRRWILDRLPHGYQNLTYVEPFVMGGSIFLNKEPSKREIISDIDPGIYAVWHTIQNNYDELRQRLKRLTFSASTLAKYRRRKPRSLLEAAVARIVVSRMSKNGMGQQFSNCARQRGGQQGDKNAWDTFIARELSKIRKRLQGVEIHCESATQCIFDVARNTPGVVIFYLDPPYLPDTRTARRVYDYEMDEGQHEELLEQVVRLSSEHLFLISGYDSELYNDMLRGWHKDTRLAALNVSTGKQKNRKVEVLWRNYDMLAG